MRHAQWMVGLALIAGCSTSAAHTNDATSGGSFHLPIQYRTLANGLRVVLSPDHSAPLVTVAVYYHIGFRLEPRGRTGFAHLFEHLMFQGSEHLGKTEFAKLVEQNGGNFNGSTRFDFTNYYETVPSNTLEMFLWAEADRMHSLAITKDNLTNQQGVVKSEVRENVLNLAYGGFPWLDMPQYANTNWSNAHNFYGDLRDIDAATLRDASTFHQQYYAPNNAVLVVCGDLDSAQTSRWIDAYFASIPRAPAPPAVDLSEPRQDKEIRARKTDSLATRPALAFAYHVPSRNTPEYFAMGLIDQILLQGNDSRLYQSVVQQAGLAGDVTGGINLLGNMFDYEGPMLWIGYLYHDRNTSDVEILRVVDATIDSLMTVPVDPTVLARARVKARAQLYAALGDVTGGEADILASYALFDNDPSRVNTIDSSFAAVTPALIQRTAQEYLRPTNRTVLTVLPGKAGDATVVQ